MGFAISSTDFGPIIYDLLEMDMILLLTAARNLGMNPD